MKKLHFKNQNEEEGLRMTKGEKYYQGLLDQKCITQHLITSLDMAFDLVLTNEGQKFKNFLTRRLMKVNDAIAAYELDVNDIRPRDKVKLF